MRSVRKSRAYSHLTPAAIDQMLTDEIQFRNLYIQRLETTPVEKTLASGETAGPFRLVDRRNRRQFLDANAYYSRFRRGDSVQLRVRRADGTTERIACPTVKEVTYPAEGKLRIAIGETRKIALDRRTDYFIYSYENDYMLYQLQSVVNGLSGSMTGKRKPPKSFAQPLLPSEFTEQLNSSQFEAIDYVLYHAADASIQGPPGTGKTQLLLAIVAHALDCRLTVGIAAFTHAAVDNALSRITQLDSAEKFARVGRPEMIGREKYPEKWLDGRYANSFGDVARGKSVYAATTHSWALSPSAPLVDILILDEAGQIPVSFLPVVLARGRKCICLGDHKQLPPVLLGDHSNTVPHTDIFSCFLEEGTPMLEVQYRMNAQLQAWPSSEFYGGRLRPHASNANRDVVSTFVSPPETLGTDPMQLISHSHIGRNQANAGEARLVADLVGHLLKASDRLAAGQVGVISPRRMHNGAIIQALQQKLGVDVASRIQVDTVERYQGQQREVIVFSFGSGRQQRSRQERQIIGDARRLNVAVTRARSRLYCFASNGLIAPMTEPARDSSDGVLQRFFAAFGDVSASGTGKKPSRIGGKNATGIPR